MDATYNLNNNRMPLYLMVTMDGSGQSEIVMACVTQLETEAAIQQMIRCFKQHNPSWNKIQVALTDKDMVERNVIKQEMPQANLGICLFHVLRTFKREVTVEKMKITQAQRDASLEMVQRLAYASTAEEYKRLYDGLCENCPLTVKDYYNKNWHQIKEEWVKCYRNVNVNLGNTTTNRVESLNAKIKSVCSRFATLHQFFKDFIAMLKVLREENKHKNILDSTCVPTQSRKILPDEYARCLTTYAFRIVENEAKLAESLQTLNDSVTSETCSCATFVSMKLPCRHIFKFRNMHQISLFDEALFAIRWTKAYVRASEYTSKEIDDTAEEGMPCVGIQQTALAKKSKCLTQFQKFRQANQVAQKLCHLTSEEGMDVFQKRLAVLDSLCQLWLTGKEATVVEVVENPGNICLDSFNLHNLR